MAKVIILVVCLFAVVGIGGCAYLQFPKFGPSNDKIRSEAVLASPHYVDGEFRNLEPTPLFTEDVSFASALFSFLTEKSPEGLRPNQPLPTVKTDLKALNRDDDLVVWLGHSSYFIQLAGRRILIDPVFGTYGAPIPFVNKVFDGSNPYGADDMPDIDYLLITHTHWDHLDYEAVKALEPKVRHAIGGLGLAAYFAYWGYPADKIHEADWDESLQLESGLTINVLPARHYTRRLFGENQSLWVGYALVSNDRSLFFSGDSGYGKHFADIGGRFDGFDLVALDFGQYNAKWAKIHMNPEEAAEAASELNTKVLIPGHVGKYALSRHTWTDPFDRIVKAATGKPYRLLTPRIGEVLVLSALPQSLPKW